VPSTQTQPNIREMARRLSLSKGTVSKALNGRPGIQASTRQRVLQAAKKYGYIPNRQAQVLRHGRTHCIQVQLPTLTDMNYSEQTEDIYAAAARHGYDVMVTTYEWDPQRGERLCSDAVAQRVEAVVLVGGHTPEAWAMLRDAGIATVAIDYSLPIPEGLATLDVDITDGIRQATEHLIQLGHRRFMMADHFYNDSRFMGGVLQALRAAQLPDDFVIVDSKESDPVIPAAYDDTLRVLRKCDKLPTAILCGNDQIAISSMAAVWDAGLSVPHDISVTGHGNIRLSRLNRPALTTSSATHLHQGELAMEMLMSLIKGDIPADTRKIIKPELVVRQSTGPARTDAPATRHAPSYGDA